MKRKTIPGRLRHRVTLQKEFQAADGGGGYTRSWNDVVQLWAEIIPLTGRETWFAGKVQAEATHRVRLRYEDELQPDYRLVFGGRIFNIRHVSQIPENSEDALTELLVIEGIAD